MFLLYANKTSLARWKREPLTSGSVNVYTVRFEFSEDWEGLTRTVVFRAGTEERAILLDEANTCTIPWEVLVRPEVRLQVGVCGTRGGGVVLPTVWESLGTIQDGVTAGGEASKPPTPDLWEQELAGKGDNLDYDGLNLTLKSGDKPLSTVQIAGGGGGEGPSWGIGHGLAVKDGALTVVTTDDFKGDNTLPMTAAGVQTTVGNIEILLQTI